jgi:pullulanase
MRSIRRALSCLFVAMLALVVAAPASAQRAADAPRVAPSVDLRRLQAGAALVVHYHRPDGNYEGWNLWCWAEGGEGKSYPFDGTDLFGRYAIVPLTGDIPRAGLIIRRGNWEEKDFDQDRFVPIVKGEVTEVWIVSGEEAVRTDPTSVDLTLKVVGAFLDAADRITLATTAPLSDRQRRAIDVAIRGGERAAIPVRAVRPDGTSGGKPIYTIDLGKRVPTADVGRVEIRFDERAFDDLQPRVVFARDVLDGAEFLDPDAVFGPQYTKERTLFSTWSPVAEKVELVIWSNGPTATPVAVTMVGPDRGTWTAAVTGDLHGVHYQYRFTAYGEARQVPDMHSHAATSDSTRSVVVDLDRLKPAGWDEATPPKLAQPTDEVIYEIHVRDFSIRDERCPPEDRGFYRGLVRGTPRSAERPSSGIEHLVELGVTAVHLLPIHDYTARRDEYNWGYWTTLFNVPEANYASDPNDPTSPIRELREAILGLHARGIRVILDVVYNHTSNASPDSPFGAPAPHYLFRTTRDGRLTNDTGVGNTIADERPVMRKYITESLRHWLRHYRIDGFRFDLLGCHEPEAVRACVQAIRAERPDATIYGEPWTGGGTIRFPKGVQRGQSIAVFNDHLRNAIRGDLDGTTIGFATGAGGDVDAVRRGVMGAIDDFTNDPTETINYTSAHDNLTLWDKIVKTQPNATDAERRSMAKLAHGVVLTSQGIAFLHGGCDFARTKGGEHNSYDKGDDVNLFDWQRKAVYADVFDYIAGLVKLRREHPAFRITSAATVRKAVRFLDAGRTVAFTIDGQAAGDAWKRILVAYNDEPTPVTLTIPPGAWEIVVDANRAGVEPIGTASGSVTLPGYSMLVARSER